MGLNFGTQKLIKQPPDHLKSNFKIKILHMDKFGPREIPFGAAPDGNTRTHLRWSETGI